jgi:hypothetical protein
VRDDGSVMVRAGSVLCRVKGDLCRLPVCRLGPARVNHGVDVNRAAGV